jgi:hypothetical protein
MDLIFIVVSRLVHAPLIDCRCRHTSLARRVRHERTLARRAPIPARKKCCDRHERCGAAASGAQVCRRTVCPDRATARQRLRQLRAEAHPRPIRLVNEIADGKIGLDLASVISATRVSVHLPDQVFD